MVPTHLIKGLIFCTLLFSSFQKAEARSIHTIHFSYLSDVMHKKTDTTYVINFFATWCSPCIKEIPEILDFEKKVEGKKIRVLFVSLDAVKDSQTKLLLLMDKYLKEHTVYLLDEPNANNWIDKIDKKWSGSIPATLIINHRKKKKLLITNPLNSSELTQLCK
jgi:thiol-disulfide isomerase/thioredoxin